MDNMRCRKIIDGNVVWFGSYGKDVNDKALKAGNFSDNQQGVADDLTQRLSVIKGELWYRVNYGLPLFDKVKSKAYMDTITIDNILAHEDVVRITSFKSTIVDRRYTCEAEILTKYGKIDFEL